MTCHIYIYMSYIYINTIYIKHHTENLILTQRRVKLSSFSF